MPVASKAIVPGSGVLAVAVKSKPPGQQLPSLHWKTMEKFSPLEMPGKLPFTPDTRMVVTPPIVETEQFAKAVVMQVIALAATPLSVSFRLNQLMPEALVKNKVPKPLLGTPKLKFDPTEI